VGVWRKEGGFLKITTTCLPVADRLKVLQAGKKNERVLLFLIVFYSIALL